MNAAPRSPRSPPSFRIRSKRPEPGAFRPVSRCECARNRPRNESRIVSRERCGERLHESSIRKTSFADGNAGGLPKGVFRGTRTVARTVGGARLGGGTVRQTRPETPFYRRAAGVLSFGRGGGYSRTVRRQFSGLLSTDAAFGFAPVRPFKQGTAFRSCPDEVAKRLRTSNRGNRLQSAAP